MSNNLLILQKRIEFLEKQLEDAERDQFMLQCLENAGVDNWEGRDYALEEFREGMKERHGEDWDE